ncbi:MAG: hypothetical protein KBE21_04805 [Acetoanaerobium sp.]|nr:hypothetical protein [Acetoanaerobium sp.]
MEINKEELEKYIAAIKAVIDNKLFYLEDLSPLVKSLINNIPKLSEYIGLNSSYEIKENILIEAVKHITGNFSEFDVVNAFSHQTNNLVIDYRVITWMRNYIDTILPFKEINKMIKNKKHQDFVINNAYDFHLMYDTNTETAEYDFIEFKNFNNKDICLDKIDLSHFSSKSFGMFLELDKYALDIDTGKKYKFEESLQVLSNGQYVPVYEVMSAKEITELFNHRFEKGSAYED